MLDKAVEKIKSGAGVQMDFVFEQIDAASGNILATDKGLFCIDNNTTADAMQRFSLQMEQLKIWCNGERQWNYMAQTNEIYVTAANSEEAQGLSPVYIMQLYKTGEYNCTLETVADKHIITLASTNDEAEFVNVIVSINAKTLRIVEIVLVGRDNNRTAIKVKNYKPGSVFDSTLFECPIGEYPDAEVIDMM
jgi:outer membrane lipoprotein-sorting protein